MSGVTNLLEVVDHLWPRRRDDVLENHDHWLGFLAPVEHLSRGTQQWVSPRSQLERHRENDTRLTPFHVLPLSPFSLIVFFLTLRPEKSTHDVPAMSMWKPSIGTATLAPYAL